MSFLEGSTYRTNSNEIAYILAIGKSTDGVFGVWKDIYHLDIDQCKGGILIGWLISDWRTMQFWNLSGEVKCGNKFISNHGFSLKKNMAPIQMPHNEELL